MSSGPIESLFDWLELNDYGYPLGLLATIAAGLAAMFGAWWPAGILLVIGAVLCWVFG